MIKAPWTVTMTEWIPNNGPLVLSLPNDLPIGSVYLSKVDIAIALSAVPTPLNGNPFYTTEPQTNNPQTIPMPKGTTQVTLTATSSATYYVVAASGIYKPLMEGPSLT